MGYHPPRNPSYRTVSLGATGNKLSVPISNSERLAIIRLYGRLKAAGGSPTITVEINGASTGITMQYTGASNAAAIAGRTAIGVVADGTTAWLSLAMDARYGSNSLQRMGETTLGLMSTTAVDSIYKATFIWNNTADAITALDIKASSSHLVVGTYVTVEEVFL